LIPYVSFRVILLDDESQREDVLTRTLVARVL
jgi:hypothetical protein